MYYMNHKYFNINVFVKPISGHFETFFSPQNLSRIEVLHDRVTWGYKCETNRHTGYMQDKCVEL